MISEFFPTLFLHSNTSSFLYQITKELIFLNCKRCTQSCNHGSLTCVCCMYTVSFMAYDMIKFLRAYDAELIETSRKFTLKETLNILLSGSFVELHCSLIKYGHNCTMYCSHIL